MPTSAPSWQKSSPDWVQYDCKGHPGYTGYPTKVGVASPGIVKDALKIWSKVAHDLGLPIVVHYSGIWDRVQWELHPEWARRKPDGALHGGEGWQPACHGRRQPVRRTASHPAAGRGHRRLRHRRRLGRRRMLGSRAGLERVDDPAVRRARQGIGAIRQARLLRGRHPPPARTTRCGPSTWPSTAGASKRTSRATPTRSTRASRHSPCAPTGPIPCACRTKSPRRSIT